MYKIYYLSTCSTCTRIINNLGPLIKDFDQVDIKNNSLTFEVIDKMKNLCGSYEALFSKRALKFKTLPKKEWQETDFRMLIEQEYTFLKRPVFIVGEAIFIGNSPKVIAALREVLVGS